MEKFWRDLLRLYGRVADGGWFYVTTGITLGIVIAIYNQIASGHLLAWAIIVTTMLYLAILALRMVRLLTYNGVTLDDLSERIIEFENTVAERLDRIDRNI